MRRANFRVRGRFDGHDLATVTIEYHSPQLAFVRVRPLRRRRVFELSLTDVARGVVYDVVKKELAERKRQRRRGRG